MEREQLTKELMSLVQKHGMNSYIVIMGNERVVDIVNSPFDKSQVSGKVLAEMNGMCVAFLFGIGGNCIEKTDVYPKNKKP